MNIKFALCVLAFMSSTAFAQAYVGVKAGQIDVDLPKKAAAYGVYGGYQFDQNFGAEVQYLGSDGKEFTHNGIRQDFESKSFGAYGTYRYDLVGTPFYAKAKLGVAKTKTDLNTIRDAKLIDATVTTATKSVNTTSLAGGATIRYQLGSFGLEAGYEMLNGDDALASIGANYRF